MRASLFNIVLPPPPHTHTHTHLQTRAHTHNLHGHPRPTRTVTKAAWRVVPTVSEATLTRRLRTRCPRGSPPPLPRCLLRATKATYTETPRPSQPQARAPSPNLPTHTESSRLRIPSARSAFLPLFPGPCLGPLWSSLVTTANCVRARPPATHGSHDASHYRRGGGNVAGTKFGTAKCGTAKLYHILPWYLRTEATFLPLPDLCACSLRCKGLMV